MVKSRLLYWFMSGLAISSCVARVHAIDYTETYKASNAYTIDWCRGGHDIYFRLKATARGWLGVGFNTRAQMTGADVIMATGEGKIQDAFADFRGAPAKDASQDVTLSAASQVNNVTTIEFSRPLVSADANDDLSLDVTRFMVWAYQSSNDSFTSEHSSEGATPNKINFATANACGGLGVPGDFSGDGKLDIVDIDQLRDAVMAGTDPSHFDVNGDSRVNSSDLPEYMKNYLNSYIGDSNLDLQFSTADLVAVFAAGEYEDATAKNSTWGEGDWNADADFNTADLVFAFQDGGFEAGPRAAVAVVPEPAAGIWIAAGLVALAKKRKR